MPSLDRYISFVPADQVTFSSAAMEVIHAGLSAMKQSFQDQEWIAVVNLGVDGPWLAFEAMENLSVEAKQELRNQILISMPLRLEEAEALDIDCREQEFFFTNVDIFQLIPDHLRTAFGER